jgi:hypothetical protein
MMNRTRKRYVVIMAVALLALLSPMLWNTLSHKSAKDHIAADPAPRLFAAKTVAPLADDIAEQQREAQTRMAPWWKAHSNERDDKAFIAWLGTHGPKPPGPIARSKELKPLEALAGHRTASGTKASDWLERNGKKDIWKLYAHDQAEWLPTSVGDAQKADVKAAIKIAKKVAANVEARYPASAPYVLDRHLRGGIHDVRGKLAAEKRPCPCSYPSKHSIKAAAARTVLSVGSPMRSAEYKWMESEIDYSRLYMAGHTKSDILDGTLLGDMVGLYVTHTNNGKSLWPAG